LDIVISGAVLAQKAVLWLFCEPVLVRHLTGAISNDQLKLFQQQHGLHKLSGAA
jgi:hypothetical protein